MYGGRIAVPKKVGIFKLGQLWTIKIASAVHNVYIGQYVYQNTNFKICLSLFGCEVNILPNVHIVQCDQSSQAKDGGAGLRHQCN